MHSSTIFNYGAFCFLLGIYSASLWVLSDWVVVGLLFSLIFLIVIVKKFRALPLCIIGLLLGIFITEWWRSTHLTVFEFGKPVNITGVIVEPPDIRQDKVFLTVQPDLPSSAIKLGTGKLIVSAARYPLWNYGDKIKIEGIIKKPEPFDSFNYPLYLERLGVYGKIPQPKKISLVSRTHGNPVLAILYNFRIRLEKQIQDAIPEPESSFLGGILLGSKRAIPETIQANLKETGTSHIIAISGANITILLSILLSALPIYTAKKKLAVITIIGLFVTLLTGASASVMRGALVACFGAYLKAVSRKAWPTPFIMTSMILLLVGNPLMLVADPGFQLSFAAFAGLAYFGSPIKSYIEHNRVSKWWPEIIQGSLAETAAATLGTAPLSFWMFHQLSLLGLVVNPLVLGLLPPITLLGLALLAIGWIPGIVVLLRIPLWLLLHAVLSIISWFAQLHIGTIHIATSNVPT